MFCFADLCFDCCLLLVGITLVYGVWLFNVCFLIEFLICYFCVMLDFARFSCWFDCFITALNCVVCVCLGYFVCVGCCVWIAVCSLLLCCLGTLDCVLNFLICLCLVLLCIVLVVACLCLLLLTLIFGFLLACFCLFLCIV